MSDPYYKKGDRVKFRPSYAGVIDLRKDMRGTVVRDAKASIISGVEVDWDDGKRSVVHCINAWKLSVLELIEDAVSRSEDEG